MQATACKIVPIKQAIACTATIPAPFPARPFTREPDPDADYQEYCGLCHVVKDGQIIYKGMRYTPGNLMGQPVGKAIPTTHGIYIHHGKKICVSRMP